MIDADTFGYVVLGASSLFASAVVYSGFKNTLPFVRGVCRAACDELAKSHEVDITTLGPNEMLKMYHAMGKLRERPLIGGGKLRKRAMLLQEALTPLLDEQIYHESREAAIRSTPGERYVSGTLRSLQRGFPAWR